MQTLSKKKQFGFLVLGLAVLLLVATLLVAEHFLSSSTVKEKIQQTLVARTGIEIGYEKIGIGYFPSPTLQLHQLTFSIPDTLKGKAESLRISPKINELLAGKLDFRKIELDRPDINLERAETLFVAPPAGRGVSPGWKEPQNISFASLVSVLPALHFKIADGRFSVVSSTGHLAGEHLDLTLDAAVENDRSGQIMLKMGLGELTIHEGERREIIKGVQLKGNISAVDENIICQLDHLAVVDPALTLVGNLTMAQVAKGITLHLAGTNMNVDATRKTALALAGDILPVAEVFTYLVGGTVPQINFSSQGKNISELGDLKNIRIEGHLQDGAVAIPEIAMNLTEVNGDVVIADGVLTATGLLARLEGSTAHSGMLKINLAEDTDLFQMELTLSADLGQAQRILKRIIRQPGFEREIDRVTRLEGTGGGKLILGDSLAALTARIENADMHLSFDYQGVPYPISITKGSISLTNDQVALRGVNATVGQSEVSGLGVTVNWLKDMHLDISAENSRLYLDELYPWLNSKKDAQAFLKNFKEISGWLDLSSASFSGDVSGPQQWSYSAAGSVNGLNLKTNDLPGPIKLAQGNFKLDRKQLNVQGLKIEALDANLTLNGVINGLSVKSKKQVDITVNGTLGKNSVTWLNNTFKLPKAYVLRTPVTLKDIRILERNEQSTQISGALSIKDGPRVTLDVQYSPEELKVEKLTIKDQHSEAGMTFSSGSDGWGLNFRGFLGSETLEELFVDPKLGMGRIEGDISVMSKKTKNGALAKGRLKGTNVLIPLPSGEDISIAQVLLTAEGSSIKADATTLGWRNFNWSPFTATINVEDDKLSLKIARAVLCGIDSTGGVNITGNNFDLNIMLLGKNLDVSPSYSCLTQGRVKMTGRMDFSSQIKAKGEMGELVSKLEGPVHMTFREGVIEQNRVLTTLLEVLNVTEIMKGRLPDMATSGFQYTIITVEGQFKNGKLLVDKLFVDGETLDILGIGEIDLEKETIDLELLAAPFKTVNTIIKFIPGVNYLMGGNLVAIPVRVKGALANPTVRILSPTSVSKGLLNLGARALKLPYKLMESILTGGQK